MRLPNGYGGVVKLSGNRRRPYAARITTGWYNNDQTGKRIQKFQIIGYAPPGPKPCKYWPNTMTIRLMLLP